MYVNELNKDALETYLLNRDAQHPHLRQRYNSRDIKGVVQDENFLKGFESLSREFRRDFRKESIELVAGGPPCQGFSGIGIRRSYSVDKSQLPSNHLYQDMAFFIHRMRPKLFLFENVEGLLRSRWTKDGKKGEIFEDVLTTFKGIPDYDVKLKLVHAKDYGVPQNRPRVLLVGKRSDVPGRFFDGEDAVYGGYLPQPTSDYPNIEEIFSDLLDPKFKYGGKTMYYPSEALNNWQMEIRRSPDTGNVALKGQPLTEHEYSKHSDIVVERFTHMINHRGEIPEHLRTKISQRLLPRNGGIKAQQ